MRRQSRATDGYLDYIHVEKAKEATTEAEAHCSADLWLELQGCIVELQLLQSLAEVRVLRTKRNRCRLLAAFPCRHGREGECE